MSENTNQVKSVMAQRHGQEDCLGCRLVSGGGLIGISLYTFTQAKRHGNFNKIGLYAVTAGVASIGVARILGVYPFDDSK